MIILATALIIPERRDEQMLTRLDESNVRKMIIYIADKIIENKAFLTEIDSAIGDGDHGIGMTLGMQKVKDKMSVFADSGNAYDLFALAGKTMLMSMGGASGVIFGSLYLGGSKNAGPAAELTAEDLFLMMKKSLEVIQERGKAQMGDKTMVDALQPAVDAMNRSYADGLLPMLQAAEKSAKQGMEDTKKYQAKYGRAKSLMERSIGHQDAGATSVWVIIRSMREFVEQEDSIST